MEQKSTLTELEALQVTWSARLAEAQAEVQRLEAIAGQQVLAGAFNYRQDLATAQTAVREAELALVEIGRKKPAARALVTREQAEAARAEAAKLEAQAEGIEAEVGKLLDQIEALEGCRYVPPASQSRFGHSPAKTQELRQRAGRLKDQADYLEQSAAEVLAKAEAGKVQVPAWPV